MFGCSVAFLFQSFRHSPRHAPCATFTPTFPVSRRLSRHHSFCLCRPDSHNPLPPLIYPTVDSSSRAGTGDRQVLARMLRTRVGSLLGQALGPSRERDRREAKGRVGARETGEVMMYPLRAGHCQMLLYMQVIYRSWTEESNRERCSAM